MDSVTETKVNYSPELEALIVSLYDGGKGMAVKDIANDPRVNRSIRSVTGKLVNLGVYVKADKPVKTAVDNGPSKKDYLAILEKAGFSEDALKGLGNATKPALAEVIEKGNYGTVQAA